MTSMTPGHYARDLLRTLGFANTAITDTDTRTEAQLWAESGAQYLTGESDGPPLPVPAPLATCMRGAWLALAALSDGALDPAAPAHQLLGERAALLGLRRRGAISPGGACRLLDCADGQLALNLPRADDWRLLPAWLEQRIDNWEGIADVVRRGDSETLVARGRLLGLAVAASRPSTARTRWYHAQTLLPATAPRHARPLVIDLSSLWAGPLCAQLLGEMGARVIKVESVSRPDGARLGPPAFFDLLNHNKQSVALDLAEDSGRRQLRALLARADIVIESARPRGLEQMGLQAADFAGAGCVWLSITGYGREAPMRDWVAYGDDAGVAAGLSALLHARHGRKLFCGDAIADPLTALHAALLAQAAWTGGAGVLLDVSLCGVVAHCMASGPAVVTENVCASAPPTARRSPGSAPGLGRDTATALAEFGIDS